MKNALLLLIPLFIFSCGRYPNDPANDAAGTGDANLAREVTSIHLLTTDYRYDRICEFLDEGFIRGTFNIGPLQEMTVVDYLTGCRYQWDKGTVDVSFGDSRPHKSIYHAEVAFDRMYQPKAADELQMKNDKPSLFGPRPQGTGAERPAINSLVPENDSLALIDTVTSGNGVIRTRLTEPAYSTASSTAIPGVGDKALWDQNRRELHVLYLHHVFTIKMKTAGPVNTQRDRAILLSKIIIDKFGQAEA